MGQQLGNYPLLSIAKLSGKISRLLLKGTLLLQGFVRENARESPA